MCESNVRMFDYRETHHVVLMTNILMHGDRRSDHGEKVRQVKRFVVISVSPRAAPPDGLAI